MSTHSEASGSDNNSWSSVDVSRYPLGEALGHVRPRTTAEVQEIVQQARGDGTPVVTAGHRSAYWRPLSFEGALVLETTELSGLVEADLQAGYATFLAGTPVRQIDSWLRERGAMLAVHPDSFGETSIGAMVATDLCAGIGMGTAVTSDIVTGLKVVLGTGEVLGTGSAHVMGASPFMRSGLPDVTGLFLASEGALGVVTEVSVRTWPRQALGHMSWHLPCSEAAGLEGLRALADRLRAPGIYDTLRLETNHVPPGQETLAPRCDLVLRSPLSLTEVVARVATVRPMVSALLSPVDIDVTLEDMTGPSTIARWLEDPGSTAALRRMMHLAGVDVIVPYGELTRCFALTDEILAAARQLPYLRLRRALYFAPNHINVGLHLAFAGEGARPTPGVHELVREAMDLLMPLRMTPYRWGRIWAGPMRSKLDPTYDRLMTAIKPVLDPDGLLNPGVSLWPVAAR